MQKYRLQSIIAKSLVSILVTVPLTACVAQNPRTPAESASDAPQPQFNNIPLPGGDSAQAKLLYQLMVGELDYANDDYKGAFTQILKAAQISGGESQLYERAVVIALQNKDRDAALKAARAWAQTQPDSREANRYILDILLDQQKFDQITEPVQAMIRLTPDRERPSFIAALGQYLSSNAKAIEPQYQAILAPWLNSTVQDEATSAWISLSIMKLSVSKLNDAFDAVVQAHRITPEAAEPMLTAVNLVDNAIPEAEELLAEYLESENASAQVRLAYTQVLLHQQRVSEGMRQLELTTQDPQTPPVAWFILGSLQIETKQTSQGVQTLQTYLEKTAQDTTPETRNNRERTFLELAQAEADSGQLPAAWQWIEQITDPEIRIPAIMTYVGLLAQSGQYDEALKAAAEIPTRTPDEQSQKTLLQAQLMMQAQHWREAYNFLEKNRGPANVEMLYLQAMAAQHLNNFPQMEKLLRQAIGINAEFAEAYNALGYTLADRNERLSEARKLIEKALELEPDSALILDSLGWLEFREGQIQAALTSLQKAYNNFPDPEVAAHLGEVLWVSGQRDEAMTIFKLSWQQTPKDDALLGAFKRLGITEAALKNFDLPPDAALPAISTPSGNSGLQSGDSAAHQAAIYIQSLIEQGEWQKLYDLLDTIAQKQEIPELLQLQAVAADKLDRLENAEKLLRRMMELAPEDAIPYNDLGYILANRGIRLQEAQALIEKAHEMAPDEVAILDSMGWIQYKLGNYEKAREWLQQAYDKDNTIAEVGVHLGEVLWHMERKAEAMLVWRDVQNIHPKRPELKETLERLEVTLP